MSGGNFVALILTKEDAISEWRKSIGVLLI
jgi:hypothetical protein